MTSIAVLKHALRMIFHDPAVTLRLTLVPMLLAYGVALLLSQVLIGAPGPGAPMGGIVGYGTPGAGFFLGVLVILVLVFAILSWAAVAWHRYALLSERPASFLPPVDQKRILAYFGAGLRIALMTIALAIPLAIVLGVLGSFVHPFSVTFALFMNVGIALLAAQVLRYSLILPAAALDKPLTLRESRLDTRGRFGLCLIVTIVALLISTMGDQIAATLGIGWIATLLFDWVGFVFGLSVLTTLYGACIEGRELNG